MDPVAFEIGSVAVRWYGIFAAAGFMAGLLYVQHRAANSGFGGERATNLGFVGLLGGLLGARLFYVLTNWAYFRTHPVEIVRFDHGGLVFYGGLLGGILTLLAVCAFRRISVLRVADLFIPALPLGHALGRIGCFLNGCCYGTVCPASRGIVYDPGSQAAATQFQQGLLSHPSELPLPVLPVQLASSVANLLLFALLVWIETRLRHRGQLLAMYLILYGTYRFFIEFLRGDYIAPGLLTPAQQVSLLLVPAGIALFFFAGKLSRGKPKAQ